MTLRSTGGPRIMYVAGLPRSGSTVLGRVLGEMPGAIFAGELAFFWRRFANRELCSCGQPLPECSFWSAVVTKAFGDVTHERAQELYEMERHVLRRHWMLGLAPLRGSTRASRHIGMMLENRALLYRSISEIANAEFIVDSGKEVIFGSLMTRLGNADFNTIHIVRDPRGVAFSWQKKIKSDSAPEEMPRRSAGNTAAHWVLENLFMQVSLQVLSNAYIRIRYEELVAHQESVIRDISHAISITDGSDSWTGQLSRGRDEHHLVASNPGVRRTLGSNLRLTLDEEWKVRLPRNQRRLVTIVCGALMASYGYSLRRA